MKKKIAIISPMILPVSEIKGGAVEQLILNIIEENEKSNNPLNLDVYTVYSKNVKVDYKFTTIYQVKKNLLDTFIQKVINLKNKLLRKDYRYDTYINKLIKLIKNKEYNKIIVENRMGLYKEIYNKTINKNNLIYHMHNDFDTFDKTPNNYKFIESTCYKILTVSNYINNRLQEVKKSEKIITYYNCINQNKFLETSINQNVLKKIANNYNIKTNNFVIGFVGRITEEKGIYELIIAFKEFVQNNNNAKLLIVGSSWFDKEKLTPFEKKLFDITDEIKDHVIFTGYIDYKQIIYFYKLMDILVIPSKCQEAFGLVALEGLAMNLKIISSTNGALKEVLENNAMFITNENMIKDINTALNNVSNSKIKNKNQEFPQKFTIETYYKNFCESIK